MTLPDPSTFKEEMDRAMADLKALQPPPETDPIKGLAKHPWLMVGLGGVLIAVMGWLFGQNTNYQAWRIEALIRADKEKEQRLTALEKQQDVFAYRLNHVIAVNDQTANDIKAIAKRLDDVAVEAFESQRQEARERGDGVAEKRLTRKINALGGLKSGGQ